MTNEMRRDLEQINHVQQLVLVRHGETDYNTANRVGRFFASAHDRDVAGVLPDHLVPLSDEGREQARAVAHQLIALAPFDVCFDSGYRRSEQTLDEIQAVFRGANLPLSNRKSHVDLRERDPGYTFHMTWEEVDKFFPWYRAYESTWGRFYSVPPGGESVAQVLSRVHMFLNSLRRARIGERVLAVTHGRVMLCFQHWLEGLHTSRIEELMGESGVIENCAVIQYRWNPLRRALARVDSVD